MVFPIPQEKVKLPTSNVPTCSWITQLSVWKEETSVCHLHQMRRKEYPLLALTGLIYSNTSTPRKSEQVGGRMEMIATRHSPNIWQLEQPSHWTTTDMFGRGPSEPSLCYGGQICAAYIQQTSIVYVRSLWTLNDCPIITVSHLSHTALHVSPKVKSWNFCSGFIGQTYRHEYAEMDRFYKVLLGLKKRVLVYNGDLDLACNFLGDQWFVDRLGAPLKSPKRHWLVVVSSHSTTLSIYKYSCMKAFFKPIKFKFLDYKIQRTSNFWLFISTKETAQMINETFYPYSGWKGSKSNCRICEGLRKHFLHDGEGSRTYGADGQTSWSPRDVQKIP